MALCCQNLTTLPSFLVLQLTMCSAYSHANSHCVSVALIGITVLAATVVHSKCMQQTHMHTILNRVRGHCFVMCSNVPRLLACPAHDVIHACFVVQALQQNFQNPDFKAFADKVFAHHKPSA